MEEVPKIDGIDLENAMLNVGGNREALIRVLRVYTSHTSVLLDKIASPSFETLADYAVTVHGIKGSSYSLCAVEVAERAWELERASKAGDLAAVISKNGDFISAAKRLLSDLGAFLDEESGNSERDVNSAPARAELENILKACESYNSSAIEKYLSELENFIYEEKGELVRWIREQFDNLEYDTISERLRCEIGSD
jgi:HPt (histidine-containing phosphotransfer) domain-containing protein